MLQRRNYSVLENLSIRTRIILLVMLPMLGVLFFTAKTTYDSLNVLNRTQSVQELTNLTVITTPLIHQLQRERGRSVGFVTTRQTQYAQENEIELAKQRKITDATFQTYSTFITTFTAEKYPDLQAAIRKSNEALAKLVEKRNAIDNLKISQLEVGSYFGDTIESLIQDVAVVLQLAAGDDELSNMLTANIYLIEGKERHGRERALLQGIFSRDSTQKAEFIRAVRLRSEAELFLNKFHAEANRDELRFFNDAYAGPIVAEAARIQALPIDKYPQGGFGIHPPDWWKVATARIDSLKSVEDKMAADISTKTESLRTAAIASLYVLLGLLAGSLIVIVFLITRIYRSIIAPLETVVMGAKSVASGNLDKEITYKGTDEIGSLALSFNEMIGDLRTSRHETEERTRDLEVKKKELEVSLVNLQSTQTQLIQSEKMASLGQMIAGLAHEINTPLGYSRSNIELLRESHEEVISLVKRFKITHYSILSGEFQNFESLLLDNESLLKELEENPIEEQLELFGEALDGLDKINELVQSLKNFSRLDEADMKDSDINACLDSSLKIANHTIRKHAKVVRQFGTLPMVDCYPAQLNQVFLNILVNAAQACERPNDPTYEGTITISTTVQDRRAVIEISDNGKGIKAEHLDKIFEPFFTTKPVGSGTGLGLSIVYKIIERHKGRISVKSQVGVGTTFTIELPITTARRANAASILFN
jgi:signal transduction histidine kinase